MNSAPVEGAERIRAEADPNRGPRPELFKGSPRNWGGFRPFGVCTRQTTEGSMKTAIATLATLLATPALADPGHFAASHGHSHWLAAGALALAAVIGTTVVGMALWKGRKAGKATRKVAERKA